MSRAQTATEYLIITSVVIIIALIVVSILGGIPGISFGLDKQTNDAEISTEAVGITNYAVSDYKTTLFVRNNQRSSIEVTDIVVEDSPCAGLRDFVLAPGKTKQVECGNIFEYEKDSGVFNFEISYTERDTQADYVVDGVQLVMTQIATEYNAVLENTVSYNSSIKGCWDYPADPTSICTCYDLSKIGTNTTTLSWNYTMQNSIDFLRCQDKFSDGGWNSGSGWNSIGNCTGTCGGGGGDNPFTGIFDGANTIVQTLYINRGSEDNLGLFGATLNAVVKNVGVVDVSIVGNYTLGGLIGYADNNNNITNSYATGTVFGENKVGGLIGNAFQYNNIINSYSVGNVSGDESVGGLIGDHDFENNVTNSYTTSRVFCISQFCGYIAGRTTNDNFIAGSNTFVAYDDDNATNCMGGFASITAGTNSTFCSVE